MLDSILELSFISSMVRWLHVRAGKAFEIAYNGSTYSLHGKPVGLLVDQGHTSNGAAGTAFVLIGVGGILVLWLRSRNNTRLTRGLHTFWLVMTVLSALLSLAALIYVFVLTGKHAGQRIDEGVASQLGNRPYPDYVAYPLEFWTPENWFDAVLKLDLVEASDRGAIDLRVAVMRGWRYNLIPLFILGVAVSALAWWDASRRREDVRYGARDGELAMKQDGRM